MDYLKAACKHLGIVAEQVKKHRIEGENFVVVADMGIKGCPKHIIPLADLHPVEPATVSVTPMRMAYTVDATVEPMTFTYTVNATSGAKRKAARDKIDLAEIAQAVKGARITVRTLNEFVKDGA